METSIKQRSLNFLEYVTVSLHFLLTFAPVLIGISVVLHLPTDIMTLFGTDVVQVLAVFVGILTYPLVGIAIAHTSKSLLQEQRFDVEVLISFLVRNAWNALKTHALFLWRTLFQHMISLIVLASFVDRLGFDLLNFIWLLYLFYVLFRFGHLSIVYSFYFQIGVHLDEWGGAALDKSQAIIKENGNRIYWQVVGIHAILFGVYFFQGMLSTIMGDSFLALVIVCVSSSTIIAYEQTLFAIFYLNIHRETLLSTDEARFSSMFTTLDVMTNEYSSLQSLKSIDRKQIKKVMGHHTSGIAKPK